MSVGTRASPNCWRRGETWRPVDASRPPPCRAAARADHIRAGTFHPRWRRVARETARAPDRPTGGDGGYVEAAVSGVHDDAAAGPDLSDILRVGTLTTLHRW